MVEAFSSMTDERLGTAAADAVSPESTFHSRPASAPSLFRSDWHWALLLVLLNLLLFSDALFTDKTFFFRDVSFFHYPLKRLVTEAYAAGEWPLWNPYIQLGQPLLANPNTMALYPTQILFQLLPFDLAFELHFVLHCMLAGVATFYLARALEFDRFSAFIAAATYNFSGVTLSFVNLFNILPVVAFLPALALSFIRILQRLTIPRLLAASFAVGGFGLLLEPLSSLAIAVFLVLFVTAYVRFSGNCVTKIGPASAWVGLAIASGLLLAAIQILPTLELIRHSGRRGGLDFQIISGWSLHPVNLLQVVFPRIFGDYFRLTQNGSWAGVFFERREPYLLSCYFGVLSSFLALAGFLLSQRRWMSRTLAAVALVGLVLASGKNGPIYRLLFEYCPAFRFGRYPVKFLLICNFSLSLLAGYGIQRVVALRANGEWRRCWSRPWMVAGIILLGTSLLGSWLVEERLGPLRASSDPVLQLDVQGNVLRVPIELMTSSLQSLRLQLGALIVFLALSWINAVRTAVVQASVALLLLFDFGIHNFWINPLIQPELYETAPAAAYLESRGKETGPFRIYRLESEGAQDEALTLGKTNSIAWSFFHRKLTLAQFLAAKDHVSYAVFQPVDRLETLPSQRIHSELMATQTTEEKLQFLAGLNVAYVLALQDIQSPLLTLESTFPVNSPQPLRLYRLQSTLPRVFLAEALDAGDGKQSFRDQLSVRGEVAAPSQGPSDWARIVSYQPNQVEIETETAENRLLVLLDSYYPGWKAAVDAVSTPVIAANFVYRGVRLQPGRHHVTFRYEPRSFVYGAAISVCTASIWGLVWGASLMRRSKALSSKHTHEKRAE